MIKVFNFRRTSFVVLLAAIVLIIPAVVFGVMPDASATVANSETFLVIIDAGHGGFDGGAVSRDGVVEKNLNLEIALKLQSELESVGATVIMTRSDDSALAQSKKEDIYARLQIAKENPSALFVSIHCNKFTQPQYSGLQVFYAKTDGSRELAEKIQTLYNTSVNTNCMRVAKIAEDNIYLMRNAVTPAVVVECGFLSNAEETKLLTDGDYQSTLAKTIATAVFEYSEGK